MTRPIDKPLAVEQAGGRLSRDVNIGLSVSSAASRPLVNGATQCLVFVAATTQLVTVSLTTS